jgi:dolichyl-diphosphooligosaccharide--protein glycosyltransferase
MVRLILTLTPIVCVTSAIAISSLLETYLSEPLGSRAVEAIGSSDSENVSQSKKKGKSASSIVAEGEYEPNAFGIKVPSLKFPIIGVVSVLLVMFAFHCAYVTSSAYSSPSVVLETRGRDGSQLIIVSVYIDSLHSFI